MSGTTSARTTQLGATADFQPTQKLRLDSAAVGASIPLDSLAKKVGETYAKCGFDYDPTMSTVQMLTQIESKLERCLQVADEMNPNYVRESEKAREKNRRMNQRSEKAAVDLLAAEEKAKKALERSMAPIPLAAPLTEEENSQGTTHARGSRVESVFSNRVLSDYFFGVKASHSRYKLSSSSSHSRSIAISSHY